MEIGSHYVSDALVDLKTFSRQVVKPSETLPLTTCINIGISQLISLRNLNGNFKTGFIFFLNYHRNNKKKDAFIIAYSFTEWLGNIADNLKNLRYPIINGEFFRFLPDLDAQATTEGIEVTVSTCFCHELSSVNPPRYFHTYRVTMKMDLDAPKNVIYKLASRHWKITDFLGHVESIEGPGVVGDYPLMYAGASFSWVSCTTFKTEIGYMEGHFTMEKLNAAYLHYVNKSDGTLIRFTDSKDYHEGFRLEVKCPRFTMVSIPSMTTEQ